MCVCILRVYICVCSSILRLNTQFSLLILRKYIICLTGNLYYFSHLQG